MNVYRSLIFAFGEENMQNETKRKEIGDPNCIIMNDDDEVV